MNENPPPHCLLSKKEILLSYNLSLVVAAQRFHSWKKSEQISREKMSHNFAMLLRGRVASQVTHWLLMKLILGVSWLVMAMIWHSTKRPIHLAWLHSDCTIWWVASSSRSQSHEPIDHKPIISTPFGYHLVSINQCKVIGYTDWLLAWWPLSWSLITDDPMIHT